MKKDITLGEIEEGLKEELTISQIYKQAGFPDHKERDAQLQNVLANFNKTQKKSLSFLRSKGINSYSELMNKVKQAEDFIKRDNRFLETHRGTTIDDFTVQDKIKRMPGLYDVVIWLEEAKDRGIEDVNEWINKKIEKKMQKISSVNQPSLDLRKIFKNDAGYTLCIGIMEDLRITQEGRPIITKGKGGMLFGAIQAMKETPDLLINRDFTNVEQLLPYFNNFLGTNFKRVRNNTRSFLESYDDAKRALESGYNSA